MAFNLFQHVIQRYEKEQIQRQQTDREQNGHQPYQNLIPSPESPAEVHNSYDSTGVNIIQPNQIFNDFPYNVRLGNVANVTQSHEEVDTATQAAPWEAEKKINMPAAVLAVILYVCSISIIVYGSVHINDCPAQKMVPITYIVMGCLMFVSRLLSCPEEYRSIFKKRGNPQFMPEDLCRWCLNLITQLVTMCFFFALCHWAFNMNPDTSSEKSANYCAKELYKNTYYSCIAALAIFGITFVLTCCCACSVACALMKANE